VFDAVLADVEPKPFAVVRPGATGAIVTAVFVVHVDDHARAVDQLVLAQQSQAYTLGRPPPSRRVMVVLLRERATGIRAAPDRLGRGLLAVGIHVRHQSSSHRVRPFGSKHRDAIATPDTRTIEWTTGWTTDVAP